MSLDNLIKDQSIFSLVIISLILITLSLDQVWISLGENWCWSPLGLKGLNARIPKIKYTPRPFISSFTVEQEETRHSPFSSSKDQKQNSNKEQK